MKKKLTNNLALKIVSVLIAVLIWLFASNASDPIDIRAYSVKVNVVGDDYIARANQTYQIDDEDRTVTVYVTGRSSVISNRTDIAVEADLTQIVDKNVNPSYVPVQFRPVPGISVEDVNILPKTIPVYIEEVKRQDFMITVNTRGTPGSGYEVGECIPSLEMLSIEGPASIIAKIKSVIATIDVSGIRTDTIKQAKLVITDQNGEVLTEDQMEYLRLFNIGEDKVVDVSVKLWRIVDDIKVTASYSGTPASGYQVDKITTTPETISVAGSEEALKKLEEAGNTLVIPGELMNVDGLSQDLENSVRLSSLLREEDGYKIPADLTQSVLVKVTILPYGSKAFSINTSDITVSGLAPEFRLSYSQDELTVRVRGNNQLLAALVPSQIRASIDLKDKVEGEYTLPVTITLPDGYDQVENTMVTVQLTKVESSSSPVSGIVTSQP